MLALSFQGGGFADPFIAQQTTMEKSKKHTITPKTHFHLRKDETRKKITSSTAIYSWDNISSKLSFINSSVPLKLEELSVKTSNNVFTFLLSIFICLVLLFLYSRMTTKFLGTPFVWFTWSTMIGSKIYGTFFLQLFIKSVKARTAAASTYIT